MTRSLSLVAALLVLAAPVSRAGEPPYAPFADPSFSFFGLSVDATPEGAEPRSNWVPRGVVVRVGDDVWALYDVDLVRLAAVWRGGFPEGATIAQLSYQNTNVKAGPGQKGVPRFEGELLFSTPMLPGVWTGERPTEDPRDKGVDPRELGRGPVDFERFARWRGVREFGGQPSRAEVIYEAGGRTIRETLHVTEDGRGIVRTLTADEDGEAVTVANGGLDTMTVRGGTSSSAIVGEDSGAWTLHGDPPPPNPVLEVGSKLGKTEPWGACDRIGLPVENPWQRPVRPTGIAFFDDGRAAVTTVDGDIYVVSGLDAELAAVRWRRFATGLHEPYSVAVRGGEVLVFDRGGLKRLHDRDGDGWAEYHEWFCHDFWQSAETRDFPHDMVLRPDGGFYLVKGGQQSDLPSKHSGRVLSVSPDGGEVEVFSSGHRNAFLGLRASTGELFAVDQQGHWVPTTPVQRLRRGGYYGFQPAAPPGAEPDVEEPLLWMPHRAAQSAVDLVPLDDGGLIGVDYFRPHLFKVLPGGADAGVAVGGGAWEFPLLKGAIGPLDGHLYLVGFQIWGTSAKDEAGFGRLRLPAPEADPAPRAAAIGDRGLVLEFGSPLDRETAADRGRYHASLWSYRRSGNYGSGHHRADGSEGQDPLAIAGAHVSADGHRLFLHLPGLRAADQLEVGFDLLGRDGVPRRGSVWVTPRDLGALDLSPFGEIDLEGEAAGAAVASGGAQMPASVERGQGLSLTYGCIACHSTDGTQEGKSGPTWRGLAGARREFLQGEPLDAADASYLRESILDPAKRIVRGFDPKDVGMPSYRGILAEEEVESLVMYIETLR